MVFIGGLLHLHTIHSYSAAHGETLADQAELRCAAQQETVELDTHKKKVPIPKTSCPADTRAVRSGTRIQEQRCSSDQEDVSLRGGGVPGSQFEQAALPDQLVGRVDHVLVSDHLVDLQHPLEALLQREDRAGRR